MLSDAQIDSALERARASFPERPRVREILWEPYVDSQDVDSLRVEVVFEGEEPDRTWEQLEPLDERIRDALLEAGEERFPYIEYYGPEELEEQRRARGTG